MVVLRMGLNALLASVRQTEAWWRSQGDVSALRRSRLLTHAILATQRKFFPDNREMGDDITEALFIADGLRDAALHERLIGGAEAIERLCSSPLRKR